MTSILSAAAIYAFLLAVFRVAGKRTLKEATVFDFVLLLIIGEATQDALLRDDASWTNAALTISTLIVLDIALSLAKQRSRRLEKGLDDVPLVLVDHGKPIYEHLEKERIDEEDILEAARTHHGLERMEQVKYAVLERGGGIAIVPKAP